MLSINTINASEELTEKEKQIISVFIEVIPTLDEVGQEKLLSFGEGMKYARLQAENLPQGRPA